MKQITKRQQDAFDFIRHCIRSGMSTSVRVTSDYMQLSKTGARCHIQALVRKGYLFLGPNKRRNSRISSRKSLYTNNL